MKKVVFLLTILASGCAIEPPKDFGTGRFLQLWGNNGEFLLQMDFSERFECNEEARRGYFQTARLNMTAICTEVSKVEAAKVQAEVYNSLTQRNLDVHFPSMKTCLNATKDYQANNLLRTQCHET